MGIKLVRVDELCEDMIIGEDVYARNDQIIIGKGVKLNNQLIVKLKFYGIDTVKIKENDFTADSHRMKIMNSPEFRRFIRKYAKTVEVFRGQIQDVVYRNGQLETDLLIGQLEEMISQSRNSMHLLEILQCMDAYDDSTYIHSVNVALYCNVFAQLLKLSEEDGRILMLCGLLHDIGKVLVPEEILNKQNALSNQDTMIIRNHPKAGYVAVKYMDIDVRIKEVILKHHERCDGSGYPNGENAEQIGEFAKIVAIADSYEAMTANRLYREPMCPFKAMEIMGEEGMKKYDIRYWLVFVDYVSQSYLNRRVFLSNGLEGEIVLFYPIHKTRPMVRTEEGFVDLSQDHSVEIVKVV